MLLVAQLRNQDPLNPMEDREFISQLAQLNTLEQMERLNETMAAMAEMSMLAQAGNLIGLEVTARVPGSDETFTGVVSAVTLLEGIPYLTVGDALIKTSDIVNINRPSPAEPPSDGDPDDAGTDSVDPVDGEGTDAAPVENDAGDVTGTAPSDGSDDDTPESIA